MSPEINKQVQRSREWIFSALLDLLDTMDYKSITISQIIKKADVARQTFYRHYKDKDDIIMQFFCGIFNECEMAYDPEGSDSPYVSLLKTEYKHKDELIRIEKAGLSYFFMNFTNYFSEFVVRQMKNHGKDIAPNTFEYYLLKFEIGGFMALLVHWISEGLRQDPEEIGKMMEQIHLPFRSFNMYLPDYFQDTGKIKLK